MSGLLRVGGEWEFGNTEGGLDDPYPSFHGELTWGIVRTGVGTSVARTAEYVAGRTGGVAYRFRRGYGVQQVDAHVRKVHDIPADATGFTENYTPTCDPGVPYIGRVYLRLSALPTQRVRLTDGPGGLGVIVRADGSVYYGSDPAIDGFSAGSSWDLDRAVDEPWIWPVAEWVCVEWVHTYTPSGYTGVSALRLTREGEDSQIVLQRCFPTMRGNIQGQQIVTAGLIDSEVSSYLAAPAYPAPAADDLDVDVDDIGLNDGNGDVNNTWLGPGSVRRAVPDVGGTPRWATEDPGALTGDNFVGYTAEGSENASEGFTILNDPKIPPAPAAFTPSAGAALDWTGINEAPDRLNSSGQDYHALNPTGDPGYAWEVDWPRLHRIPNEHADFEVELESDEGLSFVQPFWFGGRIADSLDGIQAPADADLVAHFYLDGYEGALTGSYENPEIATIGLLQASREQRPGRVYEDVSGTTQMFTMVQKYTLPKQSPKTDWYYEYAVEGAGVNYEYGTEPQDPLPDCRPFMDAP